MELIRQVWCRDGVCNTTIEKPIPNVGDWFAHIDDAALTLMCTGALCAGLFLLLFTVLAIFLGVQRLIFLLKYIPSEKLRTKLYWLVFMAPVVSVCGLLGMIVPRAAIFLYAIALVYYMICIFVLVGLMTTLLGSREQMCARLMANRMRISLRKFPLCCLFGLKKMDASVENFRRFEWLVFQSPIVRIVIEILNVSIFMELGSRSNQFFQITNFIGIVSLLIGSYGSYLIIPAGASLLKEFRFRFLFNLVDIAQLFWSLQKLVADFISLQFFNPFENVFPCLPPSAVPQYIISFLLCVEMFIVSLLIEYWFCSSSSIFFVNARKLISGELRLTNTMRSEESIGGRWQRGTETAKGADEDGEVWGEEGRS